MKHFLSAMALAIAFTSIAPGAYAGSISLVPSSTTVAAGDVVSFEVWADFSDGYTLGGGFDLLWDPGVMQLETAEVEAVLDPNFFRAPNVLPGALDGWIFGSFQGLATELFLGSVFFTVLPNDGISTTLFTAENIPFTDVFMVNFVDYGSVTLMTRVPLPAAGWLFVGALMMFGRLRRTSA